MTAASGGRTVQQGYVADAVRQQFTSKERDDETGLDYFIARYYAGKQGRFISVDPYNPILESKNDDQLKGYLNQPQNWNRYSYVWNNPLKHIDPDGEQVYVITYTVGNTRGDEVIRRAAQTHANDLQKRIESLGRKGKDIVILRAVKDTKEFKAVIGEANKLNDRYGKVAELDVYSHGYAGDGPQFGHAYGGDQFTDKQLSELNVNWDSPGHAFAQFFGCTLGPEWAQKFADIQRVDTYAYDAYSYFSTSTDEIIEATPGSNEPVYSVAGDYGLANGLGAYIRYKTGYGQIYPAKLYTPKQR